VISAYLREIEKLSENWWNNYFLETGYEVLYKGLI
jgi:hypothetical protein